MQVSLVALPFQGVENPALSLSLLQSCLAAANISAEVIYANMDFAGELGLEPYYAVAQGGAFREALLGDAVFAATAFRRPLVGYEDFLRRELEPYLGAAPLRRLLEHFRRAQTASENFIERTARRVLVSGPRIVGAASATQQNTACLALLRRLKELAPEVITVMGGPNCEREMGRTIVEAFSWVDYVISGEADAFFGEFCRKLLAGQRRFPEYACVYQNGGANDASQGGLTPEPDSMPVPDFDDYFAALDKFAYRSRVTPGLLIETSRGCWWGERRPCTFCGINGASRVYRQKSPGRVLAEYTELRAKYGVRNFFAVDCILAPDFFRSLIDGLARLDLKLMYEIKTNVTLAQLRGLKAAGIEWVQPGIESVQDDLLRLMGKGNRAIKHVELLKNLSRVGIRCAWILLCDFPGDEAGWYAEQLETLQLLTHLQPPDAVFRLRYDRFSLYEQCRQHYGLTLRPVRAYYYIYPPEVHEQLDGLAYFFEDASCQRPLYGQGFTEPVQQRTYQFAGQWRALFGSPLRERLEARRTARGVEVIDLRRCAVKSLWVLTDCAAAVALAADEAVSLERLRVQLAAYGVAELAAALADLQEARLLLRIGDEVIFLPLFEETPLPDAAQPPLGCIRVR